LNARREQSPCGQLSSRKSVHQRVAGELNERRHLRLPSEFSDGCLARRQVQHDVRPSGRRGIGARFGSRDGEPRRVRHGIDETEPEDRRRTAAGDDVRLGRHAFAAEVLGAVRRRDCTDAARLDQRAAEFAEGIEDAAFHAAEPCNGAIAAAADNRRAMAIDARFVVEDRAEAVGDVVAVEERTGTDVERERERRSEPVERPADLLRWPLLCRQLQRDGVDDGGREEANTAEGSHGSRSI